MTTITYEFEELTPWPNLFVLVAGKAEIRGEWDPAEPDVGLMRGGWDYYVEAIYIDSMKFGEEATQIKEDHPLYKLIEAELYSDRFADHIRGEIEDSSIPDPDYWR